MNKNFIIFTDAVRAANGPVFYGLYPWRIRTMNMVADPNTIEGSRTQTETQIQIE